MVLTILLLSQVKNDRRISNRQKLLAMKRYSGFLKRPEILETVYSVEVKLAFGLQCYLVPD
jgi:hypothetical protein